MNHNTMKNDLAKMIRNGLPASLTVAGGDPVAVSIVAATVETITLNYGIVEDYQYSVIAVLSDFQTIPEKDTPVVLMIDSELEEPLFVVGCRKNDSVSVIIDFRR